MARVVKWLVWVDIVAWVIRLEESASSAAVGSLDISIPVVQTGRSSVFHTLCVAREQHGAK